MPSDKEALETHHAEATCTPEGSFFCGSCQLQDTVTLPRWHKLYERDTNSLTEVQVGQRPHVHVPMIELSETPSRMHWHGQ